MKTDKDLGDKVLYEYDRCDFYFIGMTQEYYMESIGGFATPGFCTPIPPPSQDIDGEEIAVFLHMENRWEMRPNKFWSPTVLNDYVSLGNTLTGQIKIDQYQAHQLARFPGIARVLYPVKHSLALSGRLMYMEQRLAEILQIDFMRRSGQILSMDAHFREKFAIEDLVLNMKRIVDEVFMNEWVKLEKDSPDFLKDHTIKVCDVQSIDKLPAGETKTHLIGMRSQAPDFFSLLTDLRNSFVHHFPVAETYALYGEERPMITTLHVNRGDLREIRLLSVYLEDLVRSFNGFLSRTFAN